MKIFLNDRTIEFVAGVPEKYGLAEMVVLYHAAGDLLKAWSEFQQDQGIRRMIIVDDPRKDYTGSSPAFMDFKQHFKYIPAAGGIVKNEKGEILFIKRFGLWDLPKGKIDRQDIPVPGLALDDPATARIAAVREVREETGLDSVSIVNELPSTWHIYPLKEKQALKQTRWFGMRAGSMQPLSPATGEGISMVTWIPEGEVGEVLAHTYASIRELMLEVPGR